MHPSNYISNPGSSSFITDAAGLAEQHIQYLPFGELFVSQRNTSFDSRYKFTAKELDNETNYTYFGARYYDSDISIWLSVDPLAQERSWLSPYNYCQWNPVGRVDPSGALDDEWFYNYETKSLQWMSDKGGKNTQFVYVGKTHENGGETWEGSVVYDGSINDFFTNNSNNANINEVNWAGVADGTASTLGGLALISSGLSIGIASEGILSWLAVPMVMEGAYQTTQGLGQITSSFAGVSSENLPYTTTIGSLAQNRDVDNWTAIATGVVSGVLSPINAGRFSTMDATGWGSVLYTGGKMMLPNEKSFTIPKGSKIISK